MPASTTTTVHQPRGTEVSEKSEFLRNCVAVPIYRWFQPVSRPCRSHVWGRAPPRHHVAGSVIPAKQQAFAVSRRWRMAWWIACSSRYGSARIGCSNRTFQEQPLGWYLSGTWAIHLAELSHPAPYGSKHFLRKYLTSQIVPQALPKKVLGSIAIHNNYDDKEMCQPTWRFGEVIVLHTHTWICLQSFKYADISTFMHSSLMEFANWINWGASAATPHWYSYNLYHHAESNANQWVTWKSTGNHVFFTSEHTAGGVICMFFFFLNE